ncbi:efflux RND transporter permease subunit [Compostibacter hankyongensis]|uniref:Efflux RND transporter permease subunit n=2 Tax=Compostibacter hankyongensis TaxID=1007089 RepID=A0ABP8FQZ9_9BACT
MLVLTGIILLGGVLAYTRLQTSLFPEITFPKIKIIADAGQQPVDQMAIMVTRPLENAIKRVPGLVKLRSTTSRGSCEISAFMDWHADIDLSKQQIESRINEVRNQLPADIQITVEKMNPSILPVIGYALNSSKRSAIELKQLALYTIKPFLSQVAGTSDIQVIGGADKEYWAVLDQEKMSRLGLTPERVAQSLNNTNFIRANGYLSDYRMMYLTITDAQLHNLDQLNNTVIRNDGQRTITLKDIADVSIHPAKQYVRVNANGKESILIGVVKQPDANLIDLSARMDQKLKALKKMLPGDVIIKPYYVQADFVNASVKSVTDCLWIGLLLAVAVAVLFLRSWKASATILMIIPVTLSLTLLALYLTGQTFNIMTLGAIAAAIGLIIDDAIVVVEQIHRTHEEHPLEQPGELVRKALHYLLKAMVGSSLSTIVIFIPFILMTGVAGAYFRVMTDAMILTLACSFFATWILLPVIYLSFSKRKEDNRPPPAVHEVKERKWVGYFIRRPLFSYLFIALLVLLSALIIPRLDTGFLPEMDEGSIVLDYSSPPGTTLEETDRMLREVERIIVADSNVATYSRRTGTQMGFFITEPNRGDYLIQLKKNRKETTEAVINELRQKISASQPALVIDFGQVIGDMLGDLMSSVQPVEIKIFGRDETVIRQYARKIAAIVGKIDGAADVFDGITIAGPSVSIRPDFAKLAAYNLNPADFQYQMQTALEGNVAGYLFDPLQMTPVRLLYRNNEHLSVSDIQNSTVQLPGGQRKPISEFAKVRLIPGAAELEREDLQNMGIVSARLENRDLGSTMREIQKEIAAKVMLPKGYTISYGGAYAEQQQSFKELLLILTLSSLLVFSVILFLFRDVRVALIILLVSVLGTSGSCLLLYLTHTALNVGSYTGLIMIVGIIGENAIFTYWQFYKSLGGKSREQSLIYAISTRLRPKLMTALGAIIALMPLALGIGTGAQLHQPLAIAVIGGFLAALPLLLVVLPTLLNLIKPKSADK